MQSDKNHLMPRKNKWRLCCLLFILLLFSVFITGCWDKLEVNQTAETEGIVWDLDGDQPSISVQLAVASAKGESGSGPSKPLNITATGRTFSDAGRRITLSLPRSPLWSHAGTLIIGNNLASKDLARVIDSITRNRNIRKSGMVFISSGVTGKECLEADVPMGTHPAIALKGLIQSQEQQLGIYTPVIMDQFLENLATPGIEAVAPQITLQEVDGKKQLRLNGTAVFRDRKLVGSLDEKESRGFRFISKKMITGGFIIIPSPATSSHSSDLISIELTRSQATVKPVFEGNQLKKIQIKIDAEGNFYDQNFSDNILNLSNLDKMQQLTNDAIKEDITAAITKAQQLGSYIFGWGRTVNQHNPDFWKEVEGNWPTVFSGIETDITVDFKLRRTYLTDQSFEFK
jgi:Ger(x)C family germination protein